MPNLKVHNIKLNIPTKDGLVRYEEVEIPAKEIDRDLVYQNLGNMTTTIEVKKK